MLLPTPTKLQERQVWNIYSTTNRNPSCTPVTLAADGIISFASDNILTLTSNVVYQPLCTTVANTSVYAAVSPFYSSSTPQVYVVAAATVLAWVLVVMLVISPRTFMNNLATGPTAGRGIIAGANGSAVSAGRFGSRPWLQKAAALTVAVALTIATADTFKQSELYYPGGIDGEQLRSLVENSLEIRITRLVSDIFVWLAQVQTLIRLFPRHKEKVIIKWIGFALIVLDTTFSALNSFMVDSARRPRDFVDAIPALAYLFELSLSLLYAAWVIYYAFSKRRYAFYHARMKSNVLIALLSLVAVLTPVVFFVTDITLSDVAGWGDYFRWVGAAAASVVVWEWVERIEILERDEKKDGILGREVFDGDEMIDDRSLRSSGAHKQRQNNWRHRRDNGSSDNNDDAPPTTGPLRRMNQAFTAQMFRFKHGRGAKPAEQGIPLESPISNKFKDVSSSSSQQDDSSHSSEPPPISRPTLSGTPTSIICPPSRADTTSAASTVYMVRQDDNAGVQPVRRRLITPDQRSQPVLASTMEDEPWANDTDEVAPKPNGTGWQGVANRFKRKRTAAPAEVRAAIRISGDENNQSTAVSTSTNLRSMTDFRQKFKDMSAKGTGRSKERTRPNKDTPWTIIPAPARGTTWSPNGLTTSEDRSDANVIISGTTHFSSPPRSSPGSSQP